MTRVSFKKYVPKSIQQHSKKMVLLTTVSALAFMMLLAPESGASEQALTTQLDKVTALTSGAIAKTGLAVGTICSAIVGVFKNSWLIFISSIGIGLGLSYYLEYLKVWGN